MTDDANQADRIIATLSDDPYFRDWLDAGRLFSSSDIDDAIAVVLGEGRPGLPELPGALERAMMRLALFQIVAPYLHDGAMSWIELMERLTREDLNRVEELLGEMTLGELLE